MTRKDDRSGGPPTIRDPEQIFSLMMGNLPARVWIKDAAGRYVFVNSRITSELGIDREKWLGSTDEELFPTSATSIGAKTSRSSRLALP